MFKCPGCAQDYSDGVSCAKCAVSYCFPCANITENNYRKLSKDRKAALLCPECKRLPKDHTATSSPAALSPRPSISPSVTLDQVLFEVREGMKGINARLDQLPALAEEVKVVKEKLNRFEEVLSNKTSALDIRITALEKTVDDETYPQIQRKISQLTAEIASKDQRERMNNIEIKGVPIKKNENLFSIVCKLAELVGRPISPSDINFITRARSSTEIKPIIVGFIGRYTKENFIAASKTHKNLSADALGFSGVTTRIFVNDHLTRENKQLLTKTKKIAKDNNFRFVWVQNCKILVRKSDSSSIIHVQQENDLQKLQ